MSVGKVRATADVSISSLAPMWSTIWVRPEVLRCLLRPLTADAVLDGRCSADDLP